ncbi:L10-interacting MYB domain-containing protein-like [Rosa chinensis]|uniref:L10-interacting MYB domain-containing protein-like n=1 Tax=Rosa chinensis TaxID=74649 RepID=UPI001AD91E0A|nr:L10-interacting MYB domain-containing protein-like [Rosa chinensis]
MVVRSGGGDEEGTGSSISSVTGSRPKTPKVKAAAEFEIAVCDGEKTEEGENSRFFEWFWSFNPQLSSLFPISGFVTLPLDHVTSSSSSSYTQSSITKRLTETMAVWNDGLVDVFCDLCIKEVDNNNRPNTHFNPEGWVNIINNFCNETGKEYTRKQMKNKWDSLKDHWKLWKDLKGKETGLGWDHKRQTIDASDEWWRLKIEKNKEYGKLKKKGIAPDFEDKLDKMFMGISATGQHAYSPSSALPIPRSPHEGNNEVNLEGSGDSEDNDDLAPALPKRKRNERAEKGKGVVPKKEKVGGAAHLAKQINRMCEAIESRSTGTSMINKSVESGGTSIKDVMKDVTSLPGIEQGNSLWFFATRLFLSQEKREMYFTMEDRNVRLEWLNFEMNHN